MAIRGKLAPQVNYFGLVGKAVKKYLDKMNELLKYSIQCAK